MLLTPTPSGIYCEAGDFYIDPVTSVSRAVITHAHTDHARPGMKSYLTSHSGEPLVRARVGMKASIESLEFGQRILINGVTVSLHPAGHILGSAQVRVEHKGEVWVVSGDYKLEADRTCEEFEHVKCDTFITESTFGKSNYKWKPQQEIFNRINDWWSMNAAWGLASVIGAYSLGKAQRILAGLDSAIGRIYIYPTIEAFLPAYRRSGIEFPALRRFEGERVSEILESKAMIVAPPGIKTIFTDIPSAKISSGFASGWMSRGGINSTKYDIGFSLSDHADFCGLLEAVRNSEAQRIYVMHGFTKTFSEHLRTLGYDAHQWH